MFKALQNCWIPPQKVTEEEYREVTKYPNLFDDYLVGYIGFNLSYSGKWNGGYCRDKKNKRNYDLEAYKNIIKQIPNIKNILFTNLNYSDVIIPKNSIVYCDPPYKETTNYRNKEKFNYEKYYDYLRKLKLMGHEIFCSEYWMPEDFQCIWQKEVNSSLINETGSKKVIEKLFIL